MKLVNFQLDGDATPRLGLAINGRILDIRGTAASLRLGGRITGCLPTSTDELVLVVGRTADGVREEEALSCIAGFTVGNDVSARRIQSAEKEAGGGSCAGKNMRTFGPMGPYLVTADEVPDPMCLRVWSRVNGELRQDALTTDMIFDIRKLVAWYSQIGLDPGDLIMSGTPATDSKGFLKPGDTVQCGVDGIGVLENTVTRA